MQALSQLSYSPISQTGLGPGQDRRRTYVRVFGDARAILPPNANFGGSDGRAGGKGLARCFSRAPQIQVRGQVRASESPRTGCPHGFHCAAREAKAYLSSSSTSTSKSISSSSSSVSRKVSSSSPPRSSSTSTSSTSGMSSPSSLSLSSASSSEMTSAPAACAARSTSASSLVSSYSSLGAVLAPNMTDAFSFAASKKDKGYVLPV